MCSSDLGVADAEDGLQTIVQSAGDGQSASEILPVIGDGRYRLDRLLGEGAFGQVYLGWDTSLQRAVAIKVPSPGRFGSRAEQETYLAEARMAAQLDHPNAVTVYDAGRTLSGGVYVVSQFIDGRTLADRIQEQGCVPALEMADYLDQLAAVLDAAHALGIVHRNIKPRNVMIAFDAEGRPVVKLMGFGVAKVPASAKIGRAHV